MTDNSLNRAARRHKHNINNNQLLDKEEAETDKSEHSSSVLGIISATIVNGEIPKGLTLKNRKNIQDRMDKTKLHIACLLLNEKNNFQRLPTGTFHIPHNNVMTKYDIHETSLSIPVDTIRGLAKYRKTASDLNVGS